MTATPSLFDQPVATGTHRQRDPQTSVDAAKAKDPGHDQALCLEALRLNGGTGSIDTVCEHFARLGVDRDHDPLSRRLTDLEAGGRIRKTDRTVIGSRGRAVVVWEVVR